VRRIDVKQGKLYVQFFAGFLRGFIHS
jgi:hypothetical protein